MHDEIRVRVVEFGDRRTFQFQWTDPATGRKKTQSSEIERTGKKAAYDEAVKAAGELQRKLNAGEVVQTQRITWEHFRERYEREAAARLAPNTQKRIRDAFSSVEKIMRPTMLANITNATVSDWLTRIQENGCKPSSAAGHGRHLRAALNWAKAMGLIAKTPTFKLPKKQAGQTLAKGRGMCGEEHDRMKEAVAKVVAPEHVDAWKLFLEGLWHSGFRLSELLALSWESSADVTAIVVEGSRPVVRFRAAGQKARRDEIWPCPPEFAVMLQAIPENERHGLVFKVERRRGWTGQASLDRAGALISEFGAKAGVIVGDTAKDNATAHTYRRSFGTRWAKRVMPAVLKRLMRHRDINTTLLYYVDADAEAIADDLWRQFGNGNAISNKEAENARIS